MPVKIEILVSDKEAAARIKKFAKQAGADVQKMEKQTVRSSKRMSTAFQGIGGALGALGIGLGVGIAVKGLKSVIQAASDSEESLNKVREIFGLAAGSIEKFSQTAAEGIGASRQEALAMTSEVGNLLVAFGLAEGKAADMSTQMVQLAADLGSFNNVPTVDALNAIRSAIVGEAEPIRRFGADVRQARLDQIALANGLEFTKGKMDSQTKALVVMKAIMQDTAKAQGDFKRTSDGLANSSKIMEANFKDLSATLGTELIPFAKVAVKSLTLLAKGVKDVITGFTTGETVDIAKSFGMKEWIASAVLGLQASNTWALGTIAASEKVRQSIKEATEGFVGPQRPKKPGPEPEDPAAKRDLALRQEILASIKLQETKLRIINQLKLEGLIPLEIEKTKLGEIIAKDEERRDWAIKINKWQKESVVLQKIQIDESGVQLRAQLILNDAVFSMADGIGQAVAQGRNLSDVFGNILKQIIGTGISATIFGGFSALTGGGFSAGFDKFFGFAGGGRPVTGRPNLVGERGPEMFVPDQPGTIVPNQSISNNMGPIQFNFPNVTRLDEQTTRRIIIPLLQNTMKQFGSRLQ